MKTIRIFLSIAGFALSSFCFGQLLSQNNDDMLFYTAHYNLASMRVEHQLSHYPIRSVSGDYFEAPVLSKTYFVPMEFDLEIEEWMTRPFGSDETIEEVIEEEIEIEEWMTTSWI